MYTVRHYTAQDFEVWNNFVAASKNGTFLFNRGFMEYHAHRFADASLMVFEGDKVVALLPAHKTDNNVQSHWGLTYGGLVLGAHIYLPAVINIMHDLLKYLHSTGIEKLYLKQIPYIYHKVPAQETDYILFLCRATLIRRDSLSVIETSSALGYIKGRREAVRRGAKNNLRIEEDDDFASFWTKILIPNLKQRHNASPVHSLEEIVMLKERFPDNIRHFNVYDSNGALVAGTTVFITDTVAHPQYISGNDERSALGSLDFLYDHIIKVFKDKKFFDFGISNEQQGTKLNRGLNFWKESYGARTIVHDFYEVPTANHTFLDPVFI